MPPKRGRRAVGRTNSRATEPYAVGTRAGRRVGGGDREETQRQEEARPEVVQLSTDARESGIDNPFERIFNSGSKSNTDSQIRDFSLPVEAFRCADDDLTLHVQNELWQKIWNGEFINLAMLLKKSPDSSSNSNLVVNELGHIEMKTKQTKSVQNIREWTDAFLIFSAIIIKKSPEKAGDLVQYMALIREAETRSGGSLAWQHYDEGFRMRQALRPQPWSSMNSDLWMKTMGSLTHSQQPGYMSAPTSAINRAANDAPTVASAPKRRSIRPCFDFNAIRGCTFKMCKYDHVCLGCRGQHTQMKCPRAVDNMPFHGGNGANRSFQKQPKYGRN